MKCEHGKYKWLPCCLCDAVEINELRTELAAAKHENEELRNRTLEDAAMAVEWSYFKADEWPNGIASDFAEIIRKMKTPKVTLDT